MSEYERLQDEADRAWQAYLAFSVNPEKSYKKWLQAQLRADMAKPADLKTETKTNEQKE